jgi:uncharacterized membrane protein YdjX (TVP38/TMEM64 family)
MRSRGLPGLIALVALAFAAGVLFLPHSPAELRSAVLGLGLAAPIAALMAWTLLTPAMFSGTVLAAASGLAFGAPGGVAIAIGGAVLGGLAAFALARSVARTPVEARMLSSGRLAKVRAVVEERGFLALLVARLMPGVPVTALHYVAGVSPVRVRSFAAAMIVGALLKTAPYALLGQGLASGSSLTIFVAAGSVGVGALIAALLARRLRIPVATA